MVKTFLIARKDMASYFRSWLGVLIFTFFFLIMGVFFSLLALSYSRISFDAAEMSYQGVEGLRLTPFVFGSFFLNLGVVLMFLVPLVSMRSFSEERKNQTLELLFTYPFSDLDIVLGKFFSLLGFFVLLMVPTIGYSWMLHFLGGEIDWGGVLVGYFGLILLSGAYFSLGLFISSLTENQVISAMVTFSFLLLFWALDWVAGIADGFWAHFFASLSPLRHYREFALGIVDLTHVAYFCFFCFYFLFLTVRVIETRNWNG